MTLPTKPYAASAQVAILVPNLILNKTDFDTTTIPTKVSVDQYLSWISTEIELTFQQAGYVLPFQVISGEEWPAHQTEYLQLITALGTAALAGGFVLKPAPAVSPSRGASTGNVFQDLYKAELAKIYQTRGFRTGEVSSIRFRANFYAGTPAEKSLTEPSGPFLDYQVGKMNPEDYMLLEDYTNLRYAIQDYIMYNLNYSPIDWTNFFGPVSNKLNQYSYGTFS